jgi:hypothetical protein
MAADQRDDDTVVDTWATRRLLGHTAAAAELSESRVANI